MFCLYLLLIVLLILSIFNVSIIKLENRYKKNKRIREKFDISSLHSYNKPVDSYIKNTNDSTLLNDKLKCDLNKESCFVNPNLSMKHARSDYIIEPLQIKNTKETLKVTDLFEKITSKRFK
jgi:competence protein ComGC